MHTTPPSDPPPTFHCNRIGAQTERDREMKITQVVGLIEADVTGYMKSRSATPYRPKKAKNRVQTGNRIGA